MASLLLGVGPPLGSVNILYQGGYKNAITQSFYYAGYIQDDWRITPKLTLNLGLRYDLDTPRTERYDRTNNFDPFILSPLARQVPQFPDLRGGLVYVGVDGRSRHQYIWDRNNWAPRFGLAYQVRRRTVIRLGYAHLFAPSPQASHAAIGTTGFRADNEWLTTLDGITPYRLLSDPFPGGLPGPVGLTQGLLTAVGSSLQGALRADTITPWTMQWNFTIQHEFPAQLLLEAAYVGNRGLQLSRTFYLDLNQLRPEYMALGSQLNQMVDNPFYGIVKSGVLADPKVSRAQLLRPYPQFTSISIITSSGASSSYNALQISANKRFSHGVQFEGSYAWAKNLGDGSPQDNYNIRASRGFVEGDVAHRFVMSYLYELPFGRGRRWGAGASRLLNGLLGGGRSTASPLARAVFR